jgi:hypothetical protein
VKKKNVKRTTNSFGLCNQHFYHSQSFMEICETWASTPVRWAKINPFSTDTDRNSHRMRKGFVSHDKTSKTVSVHDSLRSCIGSLVKEALELGRTGGIAAGTAGGARGIILYHQIRPQQSDQRVHSGSSTCLGLVDGQLAALKAVGLLHHLSGGGRLGESHKAKAYHKKAANQQKHDTTTHDCVLTNPLIDQWHDPSRRAHQTLRQTWRSTASGHPCRWTTEGEQQTSDPKNISIISPIQADDSGAPHLLRHRSQQYKNRKDRAQRSEAYKSRLLCG